MRMGVAVRHAAAVNDHAVVQQGVFAFARRCQAVDEVRQFADVVLVDADELLAQRGVARVMRNAVVLFGKGDRKQRADLLPWPPGCWLSAMRYWSGRRSYTPCRRSHLVDRNRSRVPATESGSHCRRVAR